MRSGELSRSTDWRGSTWGGAARRARDWRVLRQSRTGRMPLWAARMTTSTTNTTDGYARTATSRSAPRRSGRVFLHTAVIAAASRLSKLRFGPGAKSQGAKNWEDTTDPLTKRKSLRKSRLDDKNQPTTSDRAIDEIFDAPEKFTMECGNATIAVFYKAILDTLIDLAKENGQDEAYGRRAFNDAFPRIELNQTFPAGFREDVSGEETLRKGDFVYFENP